MPASGTSRDLVHLGAETRSRLRSTQILTTLPQIVSELLQNSLDAGARNISIGVDCEEWTCWVQDDGCGIGKDGLFTLGTGSEQGRYGTSKAYDHNSLDLVSTFGFRGEALASAGELCCLEISSRPSASPETWSVIVKGNKQLYSGRAVRWRRMTPGTTVCIRDAFYNLPVRRLSHPSPKRSMDLIRQEVETYALVFSAVSFSLENSAARGDLSLHKDYVMRLPAMLNPLATFRRLFGRALIEHVDEITETQDNMKLEGFISLVGAHSKAHQYIYINKHPLATCDLHRLIENKFVSSSFSKYAFDELGQTGLPRPYLRRSPRKHEMKPVFVLNLILPPRQLDNCLEPAKNTVQFQNKEAVSTFFSGVISSFLNRHGFLPGAQVDIIASDTNNQQSSRKRRRSLREISPERDISALDTTSERSRIGPPQRSLIINPDTTVSEHDDEVVWQDPSTHEVFMVNQRTGNSYPKDSIDHASVPISNRGVRRTICQVQGAPGDSYSRPDGEKRIPDWIRDALCDNAAYGMIEPNVPSLPLSSTLTGFHEQSISHQQSIHRRPLQSDILPMWITEGVCASGGFPQRFTREGLRNAEVISQVDRKFIACLIPDGAEQSSPDNADAEARRGSRSLVLIDQHAADERIRVERFLKELCSGYLRYNNDKKDGMDGVKTLELLSPIPILVTQHEASRLADPEIQHAFERWGIRFQEISPASAAVQNSYTQVFVKTVPEAVKEKLVTGNDLAELIKGYVASLECDKALLRLGDPSNDASHDESQSQNISWLKALRLCPRELVDLVNSKACRGAIMFNDTLTIYQCTQLVHQLAETAFPFQCAHGRPSLVPLLNLGKGVGDHFRPVTHWSRLGP